MNALPRTISDRVHAFTLFVALALTALLPSTADAQGRCSCNNGCHAYPGQCVQRGSSACEAGFAPFCATRASTCPNTGWVSCGGECTCVRVGPVDGGTLSDAGSTPDASTSTDATAPMDRPVASDVVATSDAQTSRDATSSIGDATMSAGDATATTSDASAGSDVISSADGAPAPNDASAADSDGGCVCAGGVCVGGRCYRDRCTYHPELGFICTTPGQTCRLFGGDPICLPVCVGVTCATGEFCDERSNGACVADRCASITCPSGTTCVRNQCGRWGGPDGGVFIADQGDAGLDGGVAPTLTADEGCGCRAGASTHHSARGWWAAAALLTLARATRRRRSTTSR